MRHPRVLLADRHRLLREAFAHLLEPSCDVVGTVADGRTLLAAARSLRPDIIILDIALPLPKGLQTVREMKRVMPQIKVIFMAASEDRDLASQAYRAGASAYILTNSSASELFRAIQDIFEGYAYVTPLIAKGVADFFRDESGQLKSKGGSSPRQREVLQLLAEGYTMKEIARMLKITARTVAFDKYTMMKGLGIRSSAQLVHFAIKEHLVPV